MANTLENKLSYSLEDRGIARVLYLTGTVSSVTREEFGRLVDALTQRFNIIINMERVSMVTSSGLGTLVDVCVNARIRGRRVLILGAKPDLVTMVEQLDMYEYFIFIDNVDEGLRKIQYYT
jgi:anti-anti-sigma factor